MKQLLVQLDDRLASELERHVPARLRQRSEFVRRAIRRALDAEVEARMAEAYRAKPDDDAGHFDPAVWEPVGPAPRAGRSAGARKR